MTKNTERIPSYRHHKATGQAVVTLNGHDHYLGNHGTTASRREYKRLIAEWAAGNGTLSDGRDLTVAELIQHYRAMRSKYYRGSDGKQTCEVENVRKACRIVRTLYGDTLAKDFGPLALPSGSRRVHRQGLLPHQHQPGHRPHQVDVQVGRVPRAAAAERVSGFGDCWRIAYRPQWCKRIGAGKASADGVRRRRIAAHSPDRGGTHQPAIAHRGSAWRIAHHANVRPGHVGKDLDVHAGEPQKYSPWPSSHNLFWTTGTSRRSIVPENRLSSVYFFTNEVRAIR